MLAVRSAVSVSVGGPVGDTAVCYTLSLPPAVCISSCKNELLHEDNDDRFSTIRGVKAPMLCLVEE